MRDFRLLCWVVALLMAMYIGPVTAGDNAAKTSAGDNAAETSAGGNVAAPNVCSIYGLDDDSISGCTDSDLSEGAIKGTGDIQGVRAGSGLASAPVDVFNRCRYIDGVPGNTVDIFAPFKTEPEWTAFRHAAGEDGHGASATIKSNVNLVHCALPSPTADILPQSILTGIPPGTAAIKAELESLPKDVLVEVNLPPGLECGLPSSAPQKVVTIEGLPYDRIDNTLQRGSVTFTCTVKGDCTNPSPPAVPQCGADQTWTQTARPTYQALNSDELRIQNKPSWRLFAIEYSGAPPDPNPAPTTTLVKGVCGAAVGVAVAATPASGLCSAGSASAVTATAATWNWTCAGSNGGTDQTCLAPKILAVCGAANNTTRDTAPSTVAQKCSAGTPSVVDLQSDGKWHWSCTSGSANALCSATAQPGTTITGTGCDSCPFGASGWGTEMVGNGVILYHKYCLMTPNSQLINTQPSARWTGRHKFSSIWVLNWSEGPGVYGWFGPACAGTSNSTLQGLGVTPNNHFAAGWAVFTPILERHAYRAQWEIRRKTNN